METITHIYNTLNDWWYGEKSMPFKKPDGYKNINSSKIVKSSLKN